MPSAIHGLGVFAARRLVPGDVIIVEEPVLIADSVTVRNKGHLAKVLTTLEEQFQRLDPGIQVGHRLINRRVVVL
jgi:SET domain-containing protein